MDALRRVWGSVRRRWYPVGLVAGGLLLVYQVVLAARALGPGGIRAEHPALLAAAFLVAVTTNGLLVGGWLLIMRQLGAALTWQQALAGYSLAFLPRYIPGSIWGYL